MKKKIISLCLLISIVLFTGACSVNNGFPENNKNQTPTNSEMAELNNEQNGKIEKESEEAKFVATNVEKGLRFSIFGAYENGLLCRKDIMQISYFYWGRVREWIGDNSLANSRNILKDYDDSLEDYENNLREVEFVPEMQTPVLTKEIEGYLKQVMFKFEKDGIIEHKKRADKYYDEIGQPEKKTLTGTEEDIFVWKYLGEYNGYKVAHFEFAEVGYGATPTTQCIGGIEWTFTCPFIYVIT